MVSPGDNGLLTGGGCHAILLPVKFFVQQSCSRRHPLTLLDPILRLSSLDPTSYTRLICDDRAITSLLEQLSDRSGLSVTEIARRMGVKRETVRAYIRGKRANPPLQWFLRFVAICGGVVDVKRA